MKWLTESSPALRLKYFYRKVLSQPSFFAGSRGRGGILASSA
jgi:hypothetical protein